MYKVDHNKGSAFLGENPFVDSPRESKTGHTSVEIKEKFLVELRDIVHSINPSVAVGFFDSLNFSGEGLLHSGEKSTNEKEIAGVALNAQKVIGISVNLQKFTKKTLIETAYHEAMHSIEGLLDKKRQQVLFETFPGTAVVQKYFKENIQDYALLKETYPGRDAVDMVNIYSDHAFDPLSIKISEETEKVFNKIRLFLSQQGKKVAAQYPQERIGDCFNLSDERMTHRERVAHKFGKWAVEKHFRKISSEKNETPISQAEGVFFQVFIFMQKVGELIKKYSSQTSKDVFEHAIAGNIGKKEKKLGTREYDTVPLVAVTNDELFRKSFFAQEFKREKIEEIFSKIVMGKTDITNLVETHSPSVQKRILREVLTYVRIGGVLGKSRKKTKLMNDLARKIKNIDHSKASSSEFDLSSEDGVSPSLSIGSSIFEREGLLPNGNISKEFFSLKEHQSIGSPILESKGLLPNGNISEEFFSLKGYQSLDFSLGDDNTEELESVVSEIVSNPASENMMETESRVVTVEEKQTKKDFFHPLSKEVNHFIERQRNAGWDFSPSYPLNLSKGNVLETPAVLHPSGEVGIIFLGSRAYIIDCKFNRRIFWKTPDTQDFPFPHVGEVPKDFDLMSSFADKLCNITKDLREGEGREEDFPLFLKGLNSKMGKEIIEYEEGRVNNAIHYSIEQEHKEEKNKYLSYDSLYGHMPTPLNPCVGYLKDEMPLLVRDSLTAEDFFDKDYCSYKIKNGAKIWSLSNDDFKSERYLFEESKSRQEQEKESRIRSFVDKNITEILTGFYKANEKVLAESAARSHMERENLSREDAEKIVREKFSLENFMYLVKRGESYHFCSSQYQHEMAYLLAEAVRRAAIPGLDGIEINNKSSYEMHIFNNDILAINWSDNITHMKNVQESFKKRKEGDKKFYDTVTPGELARKQEEIWKQAESYNPDLLREEGFITDEYLFVPVLNKDFPEPFTKEDSNLINIFETRAEAESCSPTAQAACVHLRLGGAPHFDFSMPSEKEMKMVREFLGEKYSPAQGDMLLRGNINEHPVRLFWQHIFERHPNAILSTKRTKGDNKNEKGREWRTLDKSNVAIAYDALFRKNKTRRSHIDVVGNPTLSVEQKKERLFQQIQDEGVATPLIPGSLFLTKEEDGTLLKLEEQARRGVALLSSEKESTPLGGIDQPVLSSMKIEDEEELSSASLDNKRTVTRPQNFAAPIERTEMRMLSTEESGNGIERDNTNTGLSSSLPSQGRSRRSTNGVSPSHTPSLSVSPPSHTPSHSVPPPSHTPSHSKNTPPPPPGGVGISSSILNNPSRMGLASGLGKNFGLHKPSTKQEEQPMINPHSKNFDDLRVAYDIAVKDKGKPATAATMREIVRQSGHFVHENINKDFQTIPSAKESLIPLQCGYCIVINPEYTTWDFVSFNALSGFLKKGVIPFPKEERQVLIDSISGHTGSYAEHMIRQNPELYRNLMGRMRHVAKKFNPHISVTGVPKLFDKNKNLIAGLCATDLQTVVINLDRTKGDPEMTLLHELFHSVENLLSDEEKRTIDESLGSYGSDGRAEAFAFHVAKAYNVITGEKRNKKKNNIFKKVFSFMEEIQKTTVDFVGVVFQGKPPRTKKAEMNKIIDQLMSGEVAKRAKVFSLDARFTPVQALSIAKKAMGSRGKHLIAHFGDLAGSVRLEDIEEDNKKTSAFTPAKEVFSRLKSFATGQRQEHNSLHGNSDKTMTGLDICMLLRNCGADNEDIINAVQSSGFVKIDDPKNYLKDISQTLDIAREKMKRESSLTTPVSMGGSGEKDPNTHPLDQVHYRQNQAPSKEDGVFASTMDSPMSANVSDFRQPEQSVPWGMTLAAFKRFYRPQVHRKTKEIKNSSYSSESKRVVEIYAVKVTDVIDTMPVHYKEATKNGEVVKNYTVDNFLIFLHQKYLQEALEKGRYIPEEVLADYPQYQTAERLQSNIIDSVDLEVTPSGGDFQERATVVHARHPTEHQHCSLGWGTSPKRDEFRLYDGLGSSEGYGQVGRVKRHSEGVFEAIGGGSQKNKFFSNEADARLAIEESYRRGNAQMSPGMAFHSPDAFSPDTMTVALKGKSPEHVLQRGGKILPAELQDPRDDDLLVVKFEGKPLLKNLEDVRSLIEIFHEKYWDRLQKNYGREIKEEDLFRALCEGVEHPAVKGQGGWYGWALLKEISKAGYGGYMKPAGEVVIADPGNFHVEESRVPSSPLSEGIKVSLSVARGNIPDFDSPSSFSITEWEGGDELHSPARLKVGRVFAIGNENIDGIQDVFGALTERILQKIEESTITSDEIRSLAERVFAHDKNVDAVKLGEKRNAFFVARNPREQITLDWATMNQRGHPMNTRKQHRKEALQDISRGSNPTHASIAKRRLKTLESIENNTVEKLFFFSPGPENAQKLEESDNVRVSPNGLFAIPADKPIALEACKNLKRIFPIKEAMRDIAQNDEEVLTVPESEQHAFNEVAKEHGGTLRKRGDFYFVKEKDASKFHLWQGEEAYADWGEDTGQSWQKIKENKPDLTTYCPKVEGYSVETVLQSLRKGNHHHDADNLEKHALRSGLIPAAVLQKDSRSREAFSSSSSSREM